MAPPIERATVSESRPAATASLHCWDAMVSSADSFWPSCCLMAASQAIRKCEPLAVWADRCKGNSTNSKAAENAYDAYTCLGIAVPLISIRAGRPEHTTSSVGMKSEVDTFRSTASADRVDTCDARKLRIKSPLRGSTTIIPDKAGQCIAPS